jgi:hypothetical protein
VLFPFGARTPEIDVKAPEIADDLDLAAAPVASGSDLL